MKFASSSTLANFIENLASDMPEYVISTFKDEINVFTISELNARANLLAKGLLYIGVGKATPVALVLAGTTNCFTFVIALAKIGAVLTPLNSDADAEMIQLVLNDQKIHTIGFYAEVFLQRFKNMIPNLTQNERGYLKTDNFPHLKNIVTFGSIKNRGIFTTRELMLLGDHIDDTEMEASIKVIAPEDLFINQVVFDENKHKKLIQFTHGEIVDHNKTFASIQNFLMNLI